MCANMIFNNCNSSNKLCNHGSFYNKSIKILTVLIGFLFFSYLPTVSGSGDDRICPPLEITGPHNDYLIHKLLVCEVIDGSLIIANMDFRNFTSVILRENYPLREITGYLLIYRTSHLHSLEMIFPHLSVIRGEQLFGKYSLIIYENWDLQNIGLVSLVSIMNGSIRITKNPILCYVHTINWPYIVTDIQKQHFVLRNNRNQNHCSSCFLIENKKINETINGTSVQDQRIHSHCWDFEKLQIICPKECEKGSCNSKGECCNSLCLYDCKNATTPSTNCLVCRYFKENDKNCVIVCNSKFYKLGSRCVTKEKCLEMGLLPYDGVCSKDCPFGWIKQQANRTSKTKICKKCENSICVRKTCSGGQIKTSLEAQVFVNCTHINGYLEMQLVEKETKLIIELETDLSSIIEISGYLLIRNSPQLTSLTFFKNLQKIKGQQLIDNKYAFAVLENYHLENIWNDNQTVEIENGKISFHFNPKLCYDKIESIVTHIKNIADRDLSINDISPYSNGDAVVCSPNLTNLNVTVEKVNATAARIKISPILFEDKRIFLGYLYYYTEAPIEKNLTIFDSRHGCGHDRWKFDLDLSKNVRHIVKNLKPHKRYGIFVKTFTASNAHIQKEAYSNIVYFHTKSWRPGPVSNFYAYARSDIDIELHWWPPNLPNGEIKYFLLSIIRLSNATDKQHKETQSEENDNTEAEYDNVETEVNNRKLIDTKLNITLNCNCSDDDYWRGYTPKHQDFYHEPEIIFEDGAADFVYIPVDTSIFFHRNENDTQPQQQQSQQQQQQQHQHLTWSEKQEIFNRRLEEDEQKALKEYDTGTSDFPIIIYKKKKCPKNCLIEHIDSNTQILNGTNHHYYMQGLEENTKYQMKIRACTEDDLNMCGPETAMNVTTSNMLIYTP